MHSNGNAAPCIEPRVVTLADRMDLKDEVVALSLRITSPRPGKNKDFGWPVFLYKGEGGSRIFDLCFGFPEYQTLVLMKGADGTERLVAVGYAIPVEQWDGTVEGLPSGWDAAIRNGHSLLARRVTATGTSGQLLHSWPEGLQPNCMSALAVEVDPEVQGQGLSALVLKGMKATAQRVGAKGLLAPIRPILKPQYPLIPMDDYITWHVPDSKRPGEQVLFDPWLRTHIRLGARIMRVAHRSAVICGSVADWQSWTGMRMLTDGQYVVPGGLVPVTVRVQEDTGEYVEPNVWVSHPV